MNRVCFLILLVNSLLCRAVMGQSPAPPNSVLPANSLPGFVLNRVYRVVTPAMKLAQANPYFDITEGFVETTTEFWSTVAPKTFNQMVYAGTVQGSDVLVFKAKRVTLDSASAAQRFYTMSLPTLPAVWQQGSPSGAVVGDQSCFTLLSPSFLPNSNTSTGDSGRQGQDGLRMLARKGRSVMEFSAHGYGGRLMDRSVAESAARVYVTYLAQMQNTLQLTAQVISKHVKPNKGEKVQIRLSSSVYPVQYSIAISRGTKLVYDEEVTKSGAYEFTWDGIGSDGQRASNGSHTVTIYGNGGPAGSNVVDAQVNVNF